MEQDNWSWRSAGFRNYFRLGLANPWQPRGSPHSLGQQDSSGTCWKPQWLSRACGTFLQGHHNPPDGLLITVPLLQSLLPACDPRAPVPAASDTHPLCQSPAGQPETTRGQIYCKGRGIKPCPCHKAKLPLTLQTFSLLISPSVETL